MSSTKFVDERTEPENEGKISAKVHYVPMRIEFNGKASVDLNFVQNIRSEEATKELSVEFRGRPLKGGLLEIPGEYKGVIAENAPSLAKQSQDNSEECLFIRKEFDKLTYWNWDKIPSGMDTPVKLMDWLEIANVIHGPDGQS